MLSLVKEMMKPESQTISSIEFAKAIADETRQKIMTLCCCKKVSVNDIAGQLDVSQPTVSHHLKILRDAGLVHSERIGKQVFYSLNQDRLAKACCKVSQDFAPNLPIRLVIDETG
jgi:ArsR family transcriptional regulator, arsenate/arsenite/antimonite-responsive transcriptional repressor